MVIQPPKFPCAGTAAIEPKMTPRPDVECATGVVFAAAGSGHEPEDLRDGFSAAKFPADDFLLTTHAAKPGEREEFNRVVGRRAGHALPCRCGTGMEQNRYAIVGG